MLLLPTWLDRRSRLQPRRPFRHSPPPIPLSICRGPRTKLIRSNSIAWGDYDGNGTLDLAVGNHDQPIRIYRNDGMVGGVPLLTLAWTATLTDTTSSVAWGDYDGDGSLDLAVGNDGEGGLIRIYHNNGAVGGILYMTLVWSSTEDYVSSLAWGDYNSDGRLDLAVGTGCASFPPTDCSQNRVYQQRRHGGGTSADDDPGLVVVRRGCYLCRSLG